MLEFEPKISVEASRPGNSIVKCRGGEGQRERPCPAAEPASCRNFGRCLIRANQRQGSCLVMDCSSEAADEPPDCHTLFTAKLFGE